jgi:periplasmic protein TonB
MKKQRDIVAAFAISALFHALVLFGFAGVSPPQAKLIPALQSGESALTLTLVSIPPPPEPKPEELPPEPIPPEPEIITPPIEPEPVVVPERDEPPEPEDVQDELPVEAPEQVVNDADLLVKGAQGELHPASDIRPRYPLGSRLRGEEGVVTLAVAVTASGDVEAVQVEQSSGYPTLDQAAITAVRRARFVGAGGTDIGSASQAMLSFRFMLVD